MRVINIKKVLSFRYFAAAIILFSGAGYASYTAYADTGSTVSGTLTFGSTPMANVSIQYVSTNGSGGSATTNSSGFYSISNVPNGSYKADLSGGNESTVPNLFANSSNYGLTVNGANVTQNIAFNEAQVVVTVTNSSGSPASGATVTADTFNGDSPFSDAAGDFTFPANVNAAQTFETANSSGVATVPVISGEAYNFCATVSGTKQCDSNVTVSSNTSLAISYPPSYAVSGTLTFGSTPIASATVEYISTSGGTVSTTTSSSGVYSISNVPDGSYKVILSGGNESTVPNFSQATSSNYGLTVNGANVTQNFAFNAAQVAVTVTDSNGNPVSGTSLTADTYNGDSSFTDAAGDFTFPANVNTAETFKTTNSSGMATIPVITGESYNFCATVSGTKECDSAVTVNANTSLNIGNPPTYSVSGTVTFGSNPLANTVIEYESSNDTEGSATTNASGYYTISNVPDGSYKVILAGGDEATEPSFNQATSSNYGLTQLTVRM